MDDRYSSCSIPLLCIFRKYCTLDPFIDAGNTQERLYPYAKAKGMKNTTIIFKHAMKGAMLPVVSYLGPAFAGIITGSIVVEQIFRVPGLGKFFVQSSFNRDYTLIVGVVIVYSAILIVMNFLVDIVYAQLDPRITYK